MSYALGQVGRKGEEADYPKIGDMSIQEVADWLKDNREILGVEMADNIAVTAPGHYSDEYGGACSDAYCGGTLDSPVTGSYYNETIFMYNAAFEPGLYVNPSKSNASLGPNSSVTIQASRLKPIENAVVTFGHEAAHSRGIDILRPTVPHPNAELAGIRALNRFRNVYCGGGPC